MRFHLAKKNIPGLGERAKAARLARGLSQQIAATRAGMSINRLRDLERHSLATTNTIAKLAFALGITPDHLLRAEDRSVVAEARR